MAQPTPPRHISPDDFVKGQTLMVRDYSQPYRQGLHVPPGLPFKILAVNRPFLLVNPIRSGCPTTETVILDTRLCTLITVSDDYLSIVRSVKGEPPGLPNPPSHPVRPFFLLPPGEDPTIPSSP